MEGTNSVAAADKKAASVSPSEKIDSAFMAETFRQYAKCGRVLDAVVTTGLGKMDDTFSDVTNLVERLRHIVKNGAGHTPDKALGLGSDNASTIARDLLGERDSRSKLRAKIRTIGAKIGQ